MKLDNKMGYNLCIALTQDDKHLPLLVECDALSRNQKWTLTGDAHLIHQASNTCLSTESEQLHGDRCQAGSGVQAWRWGGGIGAVR